MVFLEQKFTKSARFSKLEALGQPACLAKHLQKAKVQICICYKFELLHFLFATLIYFSKAIVIDGVSGEGAWILIVKSLSLTALLVELPKTANLVSFCLKPGKFSYNDLIPNCSIHHALFPIKFIFYQERRYSFAT